MLLILAEQQQPPWEEFLYLEMLICLLLEQLYLLLPLNQQRHLEQLPLALQAAVPSVQQLRLLLLLLLLPLLLPLLPQKKRRRYQHQNLSVLREAAVVRGAVARSPENSLVGVGEARRKQERTVNRMTAVEKGKAFGSASTLVAQMGILLGMIVSNQSQPALVVASAASAISGSFGDAFSMYISETTAKVEQPLVPAVSVLITKLVIGAVYVALFFSVSNRSVLVPVAILLTLILLYYLSNMAYPDDTAKINTTFLQYTALTTCVVFVTSAFGYMIKRSF
jgi:hypothetical protein